MKALAVLLTLASCGTPPSTRPPRAAPEVASLPFEDDFGLLFIQVVVGNAPPRWFLLDSGADHSFLDADAARELGIAVGNDGRTAEPGGAIAIAHAHDVAFRVGGAPFIGRDVWVTSLKGLHRFVGRKFDGLLGHEFLERYVTKIAYDQRRITLYEPAGFDYRGSGEVVPVELADNEAFIHATLGTATKRVDARLKLDTGSIDAIGLTGAFVTAQQLGTEPRVARVGVALGGATENYSLRLVSLALGSRVMGPLVISYGADPTPRSSAGTIGAEVLHRFTVIFDYARKRLVLEPNSTLAAGFAIDHSGLFGATFEDDLQRFVILAVAPGTPAAEAGVAAGDEVTAIDGKPFAAYGMPRLFERIHRPGHLQLVVTRDGAPRTLELVLRPIL